MSRIRTEQDGNVIIAELLLDWLGLDDQGASESNDTLNELWRELAELASPAPGTILLDFQKVKGLDIEGTQFLLCFRQMVSPAGKEVALCGLSNYVREVFDMLRWGALFRCYTGRSEALKELKKRKWITR